jgi:hypothetical protein
MSKNLKISHRFLILALEDNKMVLRWYADPAGLTRGWSGLRDLSQTAGGIAAHKKVDTRLVGHKKLFVF